MESIIQSWISLPWHLRRKIVLRVLYDSVYFKNPEDLTPYSVEHCCSLCTVSMVEGRKSRPKVGLLDQGIVLSPSTKSCQLTLLRGLP